MHIFEDPTPTARAVTAVSRLLMFVYVLRPFEHWETHTDVPWETTPWIR